MVRKLRGRLTYANVMSSIAVFMAMSGVAWAAALPKNSVGTTQLKSNSVTSAKIKTGQVASSDVKDKALVGADVRDNTLDGDDVNEAGLGQVPSALTADSAQPVAFALVDAGNGTVSRNKGITNANVTKINDGTYCIAGLPFTIQGAQVTTGFGGTASTGMFTAGPTGNCPNGGQVVPKRRRVVPKCRCVVPKGGRAGSSRGHHNPLSPCLS